MAGVVKTGHKIADVLRQAFPDLDPEDVAASIMRGLEVLYPDVDVPGVPLFDELKIECARVLKRRAEATIGLKGLKKG